MEIVGSTATALTIHSGDVQPVGKLPEKIQLFGFYGQMFAIEEIYFVTKERISFVMCNDGIYKRS